MNENGRAAKQSHLVISLIATSLSIITSAAVLYGRLVAVETHQTNLLQRLEDHRGRDGLHQSLRREIDEEMRQLETRINGLQREIDRKHAQER
jgi:uncharacterized protein YlxW (UPF0749 family)